LSTDGAYPTEDDLAGLPREERIDCYALRDDAFYLTKNTGDGEVETALANFAAIVQEERAYDNGD
jgi:hypothetical protein